MRYLVLGSLELRSDDDALIALTGPKRRALLALLVLNAGNVVSGSRLADDLWGDAPPKSWPTTLQTFVYQLRRRYGVEDLVTTPAGYVLEAEPDAIDASRFEQLLRDATRRAGEGPEIALPILDDALALWRGEAYDEVQLESWAIPEATRLQQLRLEAIELRAACWIGVGQHAAAAAELEAWTLRNPLRESLWALRLVALAESGRSPEALRTATELRTLLRDELGTDPGAAFTDIENRILREEPLPAWNELASVALEPAIATATPRKALRSPVERLRPATPHAAEADRLVDRTVELEALRGAFDAASRGEPQAVLLTGPPGIGKSRLLNEFTPGAVGAGGLLLWGACQQDAAIPYLPLASALSALGGRRNPFEARDVERGLAADDGARLALYISVTRALLEAARDRLVVLVIEDLHWADDATIGLLRHLLAVGSEDAARERAQLLFVATTRPPEAGTPAHGLVGRLRRATRAHFIDLEPLATEDVRDLASNWLEKRPTAPVVDALHVAAGGNPLVLRSILGRMREHDTDAMLLGPTDLDHELWQRFEQVGDDCRALLTYAAVLGDGNTLVFLQRVSRRDPEVVDELVDEAAEHAILYADDERYWFEHPQLRQLIYYATSLVEREACPLRHRRTTHVRRRRHPGARTPPCAQWLPL